MFRRLREAAKRGRTQAKNLLAGLGRGIKKMGRGFKYAGLVTAYGVGRVVVPPIRGTARGITWLWMSAWEIVSITLSPFVWVLGNTLFWLLRAGETVVNKISGNSYGWCHRRYPSFTLLNAVAMTNVDLYPVIAIIGWPLSLLSGKNWWKNLAYGYKVRTASAADRQYYERFQRDLGIQPEEPEEEPTTTWEQVPVEDPNVDEEGLTGIQRYERNMAEGWRLVFPEDKPEGGLDYLVERIRTSTGDEEEVADFLFSIHEDHWGRHWARVPDGIDTTRPKQQPIVVEPEEHLHAKHAAEPAEETPEYDEHGLKNFAGTEVPPDYTTLEDPKERSYWHGAAAVVMGMVSDKNFLNDEEKQNRARALVYNQTKNPQSGYLAPYVMKGFEEFLHHEKDAAAHRV